MTPPNTQRMHSELLNTVITLADEQKRIEYMILATPTGDMRNKLTEANIHLMAALSKIREIE